jgi:hypothetical protein
MSFKTLNNLAGWLVFGIAAVVLGLAAEPTGSLWDCGEFISGAYKLQVVHPPGAPVFLIVGRLFAWVGSMLSDNPETIAYSVNLLSAISTAFAATFVCWSTTILARLALDGRDHQPEGGHAIAVVGAGIVAGLVTAFTTSIWFSAVEGEVYAMSTFFTAMTIWAVLKWYNLPDKPEADKWLVFAVFSTALSIGVHLLSLLTFPALAMFYYFKKAKKATVLGTLIAAFAGVVFIVLTQKIIITGLPSLWASLDKLLVNSFGLPFYSGVVPLFLIVGGLIWFGLRHAERTGNGLLQRIIVTFGVMAIAYLSYGVVIIRANANPPINMNEPSDPMRLLPYLNREQYGERPLLRGPNFDVRIPEDLTDETREPRWGRVGDKYEIVSEKVDYDYRSGSKVLFPRMSDYSQGRPQLYRQWIDKPKGAITFADNLTFFVRYQLGWMYWRYFMWNFSGRQNGEQGYYSWDPSAGHWISGFAALDEPRIGSQEQLPDFQKNNQANNKYYMIPFLLGLIGMFYHMRRRPRDFAALMALFIITGIGIIVYSNQPPNEPRERDYVLAGSFFTYAIWIGLAVLAIFELLFDRLRLPGMAAGAVSTVLALSAPALMLTQNWDDHSRAKHFASRDYAQNFLQSVAPNSIIFTYGDNDTYPLWYCQEVEGIRTDVRVVNLSLIAVDWYINQLRRAVNNSPAIKMSIPPDKIRGEQKRTQIPFYAGNKAEVEMTLQQVVKFLGEDHKLQSQGGMEIETYLPTRKIAIPVDKQQIIANKVVSDSAQSIVDTIHFDLGRNKNYLIKDELAMLDIIANNIWDRPIYWAVTCQDDKIMGLQDYTQLEGLALRLIPVKSRSSDAYGGLLGSGRVATDIAYKNIMENWRWGNFDKERTFVNNSYQPSLQSMRLAMIRLGRDLTVEKKNEMAIALTDRYFEVFPSFNFKADQFAALMVDVYARAGAKEKAAAKIRDLAKEIEQQLRFYASQTPDMQKKFRQDQNFTMACANSMMNTAEMMQDEALLKELEALFGAYLPAPSPPGMPN